MNNVGTAGDCHRGLLLPRAARRRNRAFLSNRWHHLCHRLPNTNHVGAPILQRRARKTLRRSDQPSGALGQRPVARNESHGRRCLLSKSPASWAFRVRYRLRLKVRWTCHVGKTLNSSSTSRQSIVVGGYQQGSGVSVPTTYRSWTRPRSRLL